MRGLVIGVFKLSVKVFKCSVMGRLMIRCLGIGRSVWEPFLLMWIFCFRAAIPEIKFVSRTLTDLCKMYLDV